MYACPRSRLHGVGYAIPVPQDLERKHVHIGVLVEFSMALMSKLDGINRHSFNSFRLRVGESHKRMLSLARTLLVRGCPWPSLCYEVSADPLMLLISLAYLTYYLWGCVCMCGCMNI